MRTLDISVAERSSRTAAEWLWPLLPIGASVFCLSALIYYHVKHGLVEVRSALQVVIAGIYETVGLAPAVMFFLLALTWSSIWFVTGKIDRPLLRVVRLLAMTVMLGVFLNLGDGGVAAAAHKGELGAWLAGCLVAAFGYFPSIVLVWAVTFASLLLATDFFFSDGFERLRQRPVAEQGVETAVTDHLRGLGAGGASAAPATSAPLRRDAAGATALASPEAIEAIGEFAPDELAIGADADEALADAAAEALDEPRFDDDEDEAAGSLPRRRSYFERRYAEADGEDESAPAALDVTAAAEWGGGDETEAAADASADGEPTARADAVVAGERDDDDGAGDFGADGADADERRVPESAAGEVDDAAVVADDELDALVGEPDQAPPEPTFVSLEAAPLDEPAASETPAEAEPPADVPASAESISVRDGMAAAAEAAAGAWAAADEVDDEVDGAQEADDERADDDVAAAERADDDVDDDEPAETRAGDDEVWAEDEEVPADPSAAEPVDEPTAEPVAETVVPIPRPEAPPRERTPARQQRLFAAEVDEGLVQEAIELASGQSRVTASQLQRRLRIDYQQAVDLMAQLGARGLVELEADATQGRVIV